MVTELEVTETSIPSVQFVCKELSENFFSGLPMYLNALSFLGSKLILTLESASRENVILEIAGVENRLREMVVNLLPYENKVLWKK